MPRKKLNFPSKAKRKELLTILREQLEKDPQLAQNEQYKAYVNAWVALDQKMEALSAEDANGVPKLLTNEEADDLAETMMATAQAGELYLAAAGYAGAADSAPAQLAEQFQEYLAKDFSAVKAYDPAVKQLSLAELQENARTTTIDLKDQTFEAMKNMQNERLPMSIVNAKGEERLGVFTKPTYVRVKGKYLDIIEKAKAACGDPNDPDPAKAQAAAENRQKLDNYLMAFRQMKAGVTSNQRGRKLAMNSSDDMTVGFLIRNLSNEIEGDLTPDHALIELQAVGIHEAEKIPKAALKILADGFTELKDDIPADLNLYQLELVDGDRLDNRNVAMTAISDAFGMGDLLARSESMKFVGENGEVTEGTFMEYGKGVDLYQKPHLFKHMAINPYGDLENRNRLFKQISDIQVLDYICLNKDRHPGNLFYQIDKDTGRLRGFQGIDNDSSCGPARWPKYELSRLGVVTKSTADKIKAMAETPERLRFVLRGRGLKPAEVDAAVERLRDLNDGIEKQTVKVIDDNQIGRYDIKDFYPKSNNKKASNLFRALDEYIAPRVKYYRDADKPFEPLPDQPKPTLKEVAAADRRYTVGGLTDELGKVSRLAGKNEAKTFKEKLNKAFRGSSEYYDEMVTAARNSAALQRQLLEDRNVNKGGMLNEAGSLTTLTQVNESFETLQQKAMTYLQYKVDNSKMRPKPQSIEELRGKNEYEQKHIDFAKNILQTVSNYQKSLSRPETEDEKANLQANQERRELESRRAEKARNNPEQGAAPQA